MPRLNHQKRLEIALAVLRGEDVAKICAKFGVQINQPWENPRLIRLLGFWHGIKQFSQFPQLFVVKNDWCSCRKEL